MLTDCEIEGMRTTSESAMPATCTITRRTAAGAFDAASGLYADPTTSTIYTGACRVRTMSTGDMPTAIGDLHEVKGDYIATIPHSATGVQVDDFVTLTDGTDSDLIGRPLRVTDVRWSEWLIDRRLVLEDLQQP